MWCITRYVPAYSPRLRFQQYWWELLPLEADDKMGAADPVYTESFWNSLSIRAYQQEGYWYEEFILFIGVCVTFISIISIFTSTSFLRKRLKRAWSSRSICAWHTSTSLFSRLSDRTVYDTCPTFTTARSCILFTNGPTSSPILNHKPRWSPRSACRYFSPSSVGFRKIWDAMEDNSELGVWTMELIGSFLDLLV